MCVCGWLQVVRVLLEAGDPDPERLQLDGVVRNHCHTSHHSSSSSSHEEEEPPPPFCVARAVDGEPLPTVRGWSVGRSVLPGPRMAD